jgi:hypothetical protein
MLTLYHIADRQETVKRVQFVASSIVRLTNDFSCMGCALRALIIRDYPLCVQVDCWLWSFVSICNRPNVPPKSVQTPAKKIGHSRDICHSQDFKVALTGLARLRSEV